MSLVEAAAQRMPRRAQEFVLARVKAHEARTVNSLINRLSANPEALPNHVLIIPDGNRRGAKKIGVSKADGHELGATMIYEDLDVLGDLPIPNVTIWGLSTDNFESRDPEEVEYLQSLFIKFVGKYTPNLEKKNGKFIHLGRTDRIKPELVSALKEAEFITKDNTGQVVRIGIDYNWTNETESLLKKYTEVVLREGQEVPINIALVKRLREESRLGPDVDLVIRPGGEKRSSGFGPLVDQAEFVFMDRFQTETRPIHILRGIENYTKRQRRFGH